MSIFTASPLSSGNLFYPIEVHTENDTLTLKKPGLIRGRDKTIPYNKITSVEVYSPIFGFSKVIISCYGMDNLTIEGFERYVAEEIRDSIKSHLK